MRPVFVNIGERTNVTGSSRFKKLVIDGDYNAALAVARDQIERERSEALVLRRDRIGVAGAADTDAVLCAVVLACIERCALAVAAGEIATEDEDH